MLNSLYQSKQSILKKSQEFFQSSSSLIPKVGCELEFFLLKGDMQTPASKQEVDNFIFEIGAEKEQGISQIEIKTNFSSNLSRLCRELEEKKEFIKYLAITKGLFASFAAQPFIDDCGSALQFNISLHNQNDENIFNKNKQLLQNSAYSILSLTNFIMILLAPNAEDYTRFSFDLNYNLFKQGKYSAPVNLSFGSDNRTCAIRIPATMKGRLEYRIASASADCWLCISAILIAMTVRQEVLYFDQIFGNAFDKQYHLKGFCKNLKEAKIEFFKEENFIKKKMEEFLDG